MAGLIEKRGLAKWVIGLFEAGRTTREIEATINQNLVPGQEPISQSTIARFLQPYRDALNEEKRNLVNKSFPEDLQTLNILVAKNAAIAQGLEWNEREGCPMRQPDGSYKRRTYKPAEQIAASKVAISAILEKFKHLTPEERKLYAVDGQGQGFGSGNKAEMSDSELNARIAQLLKRVGGQVAA